MVSQSFTSKHIMNENILSEKNQQSEKGCPAFEALFATFKAIGWPCYYQDDLFIWDQQTLFSDGAPKEFCWSVRPAGTFLYWGNAGDTWHVLYWELRLRPGSRFFHWDGSGLRELDLQEAVTIIERLEMTANSGKVTDLGSPGPYGVPGSFLDQLKVDLSRKTRE